MRKFAALVALAALSLTGCGDEEHGVSEGRVVGRDHTPMWVQMVPGGNNIMVPITHPAQWKVKVEGVGADGTTHRQWFEVSQDTYNACTDGSRWESGRCLG